MRIKNWEKFQHFKDRRPPWVKLYWDLLDDQQWHKLDESAAKLLVMLWLLASEDETYQGNLPPIDEIAFRVRLPQKQVESMISKLSHWLIQDDINAISGRYQVVPVAEVSEYLETERETEREKNARRRAARQCPTDFEITEGMQAWAEDKTPGVDLQRETEKFKDYTFKSSMTDWEGAWRNWIRRAHERINGGRSSPPQQESFV